MYPREYFDTYWRGDLRDEVFVIMSFADEFTQVWLNAIKPAIDKDTNGRPFAHRVDATVLAGSIITEILDGIAHAKLIFADVSVCAGTSWQGQRNGNVMYELGLAHALRHAQELVVVRSDQEDINFDIAGIKIQNYKKSNLGEARKTFAKLLNGAMSELDSVKQLRVVRAAESLDVDTLELMISCGKDDYFSVRKATTPEITMSQMADGTKDAVRLLLALTIIRLDANISSSAYAYRWTEFGKAVLARLGIR